MPIQAIIGCIGILVTIIGILGGLSRQESKWRVVVRIGLGIIGVAIIIRFGPDMYRTLTSPARTDEIAIATATPSPSSTPATLRVQTSASPYEMLPAAPTKSPRIISARKPTRPKAESDDKLFNEIQREMRAGETSPLPTEPKDDEFGDIQTELENGEDTPKNSSHRTSPFTGYHCNRFENETNQTIVYETLGKGKKWVSITIAPKHFTTQWWSDPNMAIVRFGSGKKQQRTVTQLNSSPVKADDPKADSLPTYRFVEAEDGRIILLKD